jgi:hypothetical protein
MISSSYFSKVIIGFIPSRSSSIAAQIEAARVHVDVARCPRRAVPDARPGMTPEQRYLLDIDGFVLLPDAVEPEALVSTRSTTYDTMARGGGFDWCSNPVLAALAFSPAAWPMVLELIRASAVSRCLVRARCCCTAQTKPALPAVEAPRAMFRWPADGPPGHRYRQHPAKRQWQHAPLQL